MIVFTVTKLACLLDSQYPLKNLLLDGLVCNRKNSFTRLLYFDSPYGLAKLQRDS